jgi:ribose-phosphate pyrophosphokinase
LYAAPILDKHFKSLNIPQDEIVIVSPDEGSIKRSLQHQENLGGSLAIVDKRRANALETRQANLIGGPIEGKTALIFDDMITTAGSITGAVRVAREHGARRVFVSATHGVFCGPAVERLNEAQVDGIIVTNTCPDASNPLLRNLTTVSVAPLLGEAIRRVHRNESVSHLFD